MCFAWVPNSHSALSVEEDVWFQTFSFYFVVFLMRKKNKAKTKTNKQKPGMAFEWLSALSSETSTLYLLLLVSMVSSCTVFIHGYSEKNSTSANKLSKASWHRTS